MTSRMKLLLLLVVQLALTITHVVLRRDADTWSWHFLVGLNFGMFVLVYAPWRCLRKCPELMRAFALSAVEQLPVVSPAVAVSTIDRTNYAQVAAAVGAGKSNGEAPSTHTAQPWWKFW
jgi:hypothetical protein